MKKILAVSALALLSSAAFAGGISEPVAAAPVATAAVVASDFNPGIYVGLQGGYADSGLSAWQDYGQDYYAYDGQKFVSIGSAKYDISNDTGFAGRVFAGYDINKYFAVEAGYFYMFPKATVAGVQTVLGVTNKSDLFDVRTQAIDLVAKIKAPIMDNFGLYAKAGPGYLMQSYSTLGTKNKDNVNQFNLVYGFGAYYTINNVAFDLSYTRYNSGRTKLASDNWQPSVDFYALGVSYKFNLPV